MSPLRIIVVCTILVVGLTSLTFSRTGDDKEKSENYEPLVRLVQNVLAGKSLEEKGVVISRGAILVIGGSTENLADVVAGKVKSRSLVEKTQDNPASIKLKMNDAENAAWLILGTQTGKDSGKRFHTVVFMKDSLGIWQADVWSVNK